MRFQFESPRGEITLDPTQDFLQGVILHRGEEYWNDRKGTGDCVIECELDSKTVSLSFTLREPLGFVVQHCVMNVEDPFVAVSSDDYSRTTEVVLGGEPWTIPVAFVVSKQSAWQAVEDFLVSGKRSRKLKWVELLKEQW